jgi:hypothetical protein
MGGYLEINKKPDVVSLPSDQLEKPKSGFSKDYILEMNNSNYQMRL